LRAATGGHAESARRAGRRETRVEKLRSEAMIGLPFRTGEVLMRRAQDLNTWQKNITGRAIESNINNYRGEVNMRARGSGDHAVFRIVALGSLVKP
jgi:hypothetical protein